MRLKIWDRIFGAVSGLIILGIGVGLFVFGSGIFPFRLDTSFLDQSFALWQRVVMVILAAGLCLLGMRGVLMLFRSNRERGFILQHTEYGDLSIATTAMENMVKKCVDTHEELKVNATRIHHARDGMVVSIRIALASGVNIPITVSALQKQIKQYITSCSGVDVKEVRVMVETNNNLAARLLPKQTDILPTDAEAIVKTGTAAQQPAPAAAQTAPQANTDAGAPKVPLHQRLFHREEKLQHVPEPPKQPDEATPVMAAEQQPGDPVETSEPMPETEQDPISKEEE
ncbi:MAG: alkaline shock response membrane anchor protein AmaP [Candidatus Limiplasma sp.]|nr:alkaline shock response membrane anchor protein AmaP [Candidatus Limiplasma sp.]